MSFDEPERPAGAVQGEYAEPTRRHTRLSVRTARLGITATGCASGDNCPKSTCSHGGVMTTEAQMALHEALIQSLATLSPAARARLGSPTRDEGG